MRTAMHVREARGDDWAAIRFVFAEAGTRAWANILSPEALAGLKAADRWQTAIYSHDPTTAVLVVEAEAQVIGFAVLRRSEDEDATPLTGEVDSFYTHPRFWGRGAGQALMAAVLEKARAARFTRLTLWTEERNARPRRFYELAGWRLGSAVRSRDVRGSQITEVRYLKEL